MNAPSSKCLYYSTSQGILAALAISRVASRRIPWIDIAIAAGAALDGKLTAHVFRRNCATELVRGNANLWHVSRLLGHESLDTLQHYAKLDVTDLRKTHHLTHPRERDEEARGR